MFLSFLEFKFCTPFVKFIPKDFIIFAAIVNEIIFLISFSDYSSLVYRNTSDFWYTDLISCNFNLFISSSSLSVDSLGFLIGEIHILYKYKNTSFFPIWMPLISFSCRISLDRTLDTVLNRRVRVDFVYWFLILMGESFQSFTIKYDNSCGFLVDALYLVEEVPFYS